MRKTITAGFLSLFFSLAAMAQNGSPHGILNSWFAPTIVGGNGTIGGYHLYRCVGSCTVSSTGWIQVGGLISAAATTPNCQVGEVCYLDPAAGLSVNTTYTYAVGTVDSTGNESAWDVGAPVAVGASFPQNPNVATGLGSKVQ